MNNLFARCPPEFTTVLTTLTGALTSIDKDVRREMDEVMTEQVLAPMEALGDLLDEVRVDCHSREYLKVSKHSSPPGQCAWPRQQHLCTNTPTPSVPLILTLPPVQVDYDAHHRQSTNLKSKASTDTAALSKVERKELADRRKLSEATKNLVDTFDEIEAKRWNVVLEEMNTFVNIQKQFFQRGSAVMNAIQNFPPGGAVAPIPATYAVSTPFGPIRENGRLPGCDYLYDGTAPPDDSTGGSNKFGSGGALSPPPQYPDAQPAPIKAPVEAAGGKPAASPGGGAVLSPSVAAAAAASSRRRSSVDGGRHAEAASRAVAASSGSKRGLPPPPPVKRQAADRARALYTYSPANADELGMSVGDIIAVSKRHDDGWGEGENESNGQRGMFPLNYVQAV